MENEVIEYRLDDEDIEQKRMTVYHNRRVLIEATPRKCICFISGSYQLTFHAYIKKMIYDLQQYHLDIFTEYECLVFEKLDSTSITVYKDVAHCIRKRYKEAQWNELIIIGFSAGGVVASHIASHLKDISCTKKIITYDTPYHIMDNVARFEKNWLYRLDYLFFILAYCIYKRSKEENTNGNMISLKQIIYGYGTAAELFAMVQRIHLYTYENIYYLSSFNMDQEARTKVINISNQYDPILYKETHYQYLNRKASEGIILSSLTHIVKKGTIGHCSDMAFDTIYLNDIVTALRV
jgi:hypothetical protein